MSTFFVALRVTRSMRAPATVFPVSVSPWCGVAARYSFLADAMMVVALLASSPASAQSFDELAVRLLEHPDVVVLREQAQAQREMSTAAGALPDPVIALGVNNVPVSDPSFDQFLPSNKAFEFRQRVPSGRLRDAIASSASPSSQRNRRRKCTATRVLR